MAPCVNEDSSQKHLLVDDDDDNNNDDDAGMIPSAQSNLSFDGSVLTSDLLGEDKYSSDEFELVDYLELIDQLSEDEYKPRTRQIVQTLQEERENTAWEVEEMREAMSNIMEAVGILSRQMRTRHLNVLVEPNGEHSKPSSTTEQLEEDSSNRNPGCTQDYSSQGKMCRSVADYMNEDSKKLSDLISATTMLGSVGTDLMSLSHSCRMVEDNSLYISQEASASIRDIQALNENLSMIQDKYSKVERCAKRLYKENKRLKRNVKHNDAEKKLLVKEIKLLRQEKETRKGWDEQILDSYGVHEKIMMGDSPRSVIKSVMSDMNEMKNAKEKNLVMHGSEQEGDYILPSKSSSTDPESEDNKHFIDETRIQAEGDSPSSKCQDLLVNFPVLQLSPSNGSSDRKAKGSTLELTSEVDSGRSDSKKRSQGRRIPPAKEIVRIRVNDSSSQTKKVTSAKRYLPFGKR